MNEHFLEQAIAPLRARLIAHPIYGRVHDRRSLRIFMASHVFAVWDFMSLLKSLQRSLTCVTVPWSHPADPRASRLVNAIVLAEESDEIGPDEFTSHFELYVAAMREVGASTGVIEAFVRQVRAGAGIAAALEAVDAPFPTRGFVTTTMDLAERRPVHDVAAAFLHGREDLVPEMFRRILTTLDTTPSLPLRSFKRYLDRHVELDGNDHSPMAHQLLRSLCGDDPARWASATDAAAVALEARIRLWDGVLAEIDARPEATTMHATAG